MEICKECGMSVNDGEYHPYAACLMFKGCHDSDVVQANLDAIVAHGIQCEVERHGEEKAQCYASLALDGISPNSLFDGIEKLRAKAATVDDLAALVRRLAAALRSSAPNALKNDLPEKALDYLKRVGLHSQVLRDYQVQKETVPVKNTKIDPSNFKDK